MLDIAADLAQMLLVLLLAPLLTGFVRKVKARLTAAPGAAAPPALSQSRPAVPQGSRSCRERILAVPRRSLSRVRAHAGRRSLVPTIATERPFALAADFIAIVALLASARFFLALAGLDIGTSFGGIGSSREVMIASLAEPAMMMVIFSIGLIAGSTNLSAIVEFMASHVEVEVSFGARAGRVSSSWRSPRTRASRSTIPRPISS